MKVSHFYSLSNSKIVPSLMFILHSGDKNFPLNKSINASLENNKSIFHISGDQDWEKSSEVSHKMGMGGNTKGGCGWIQWAEDGFQRESNELRAPTKWEWVLSGSVIRPALSLIRGDENIANREKERRKKGWWDEWAMEFVLGSACVKRRLHSFKLKDVLVPFSN